jgi:hypothetical protein
VECPFRRHRSIGVHRLSLAEVLAGIQRHALAGERFISVDDVIARGDSPLECLKHALQALAENWRVQTQRCLDVALGV